MAVWQYRIHRIEVQHDADLDRQIEDSLQEFGSKGWELIQVLHRQRVPEDPIYRMIFKTEKTLD
jgi:hypothetical protein